jgi:hypothetical protein
LWAAVGVWYGEFAGFALIGEENPFEQKVGGRQLYWAGAALAVALVAIVLTVFGVKRPRMLGAAGALVLTSLALSVPGWDARDASIHPRFGGELRAFRPPAGVRLVQQKTGGMTAHRIWQSNRDRGALCDEVEREFRRFASNVTRDKEQRCSFDGDRGDFATSVVVAFATSFDHYSWIEPLDPSTGRVAIYLDLYAG